MVVLQLNTDWTSSHIDWLSGATAGSLLVLHLELYSGQFVQNELQEISQLIDYLDYKGQLHYGHNRCLCMMGP